jgi:hypothetical protein
MRKTLALIFIVGLSVAIAKADEKPTPLPSQVTLDKDVRLACLTDAKPQKIGVLTYYPNQGGGYTFKEGNRIAFYALPYLPVTHKREQTVNAQMGNKVIPVVVAITFVTTIGLQKMSFGGQTVYRCHMEAHIPADRRPATLLRVDMPIAEWTRESADGKFRLSIMVEDNETRLKLKSIVPVLEHAEHAR